MKIITNIKKMLNITFALFTCLSFALIVMYRTTGIYGGMMWAWTDIERMFVDILIFAATAGVCVTVVDIIPKLPSAVKYITKFALIYAAFWFWMLDGAGVSGSQKMIMSTVYVITYAVLASLGVLLKHIEKKLCTKESKYKKVYNDINEEK